MSLTTRKAQACVGVLVAGVLLAGCGSTDTPGTGAGSSPAPTSAPAGSTAAAPSATKTPAAGPHNEADVDFASSMIPHHAQAIEMTNLILLKQDVNPAVIDVATKINTTQAPEIEQMSGWLAGWGADPSPSAMVMDHDMGDGMMNPADLEALELAEGDDAAKKFLAGMVKHHEGATRMAKTELEKGQNADAKALAQSIITAQETQIEEMKTLLEDL